MAFDVLKTKCGHNVVLSKTQSCPRCIDSARERAFAKAGPPEPMSAGLIGEDELEHRKERWPETFAPKPIAYDFSGLTMKVTSVESVPGTSDMVFKARDQEIARVTLVRPFNENAPDGTIRISDDGGMTWARVWARRQP